MKIKKLFSVACLFLVFTGCSYKNIDGSTDFTSLIKDSLVQMQKPLENGLKSDIILVSDFVNTQNLKNNSKLGFLLSDLLKNQVISHHNLRVKEVELARNFTLGKSGFNLLSRDSTKILNTLEGIHHALVGSYSITDDQLIIFIKLINISDGTISASSTVRTQISKEVLELEDPGPLQGHTIHSPMVL